jgi:putative transposase
LDNSFQRFFSKTLQAGFPKFKSRENPIQSFQYPQGVKIDFDDSSIFLPKIGKVTCIFHRQFLGNIKTCTVSKTATGKYFVSVLVDDLDLSTPTKIDIKNISQAVGIDVGIKEFATLSNGEVIANQRHLKSKLARLAVKQRQLSKKLKGSNNRSKAKFQVARVHEKIANQRNDFLHKLSHKLINENQVIVCEDLYIKGMIKNHCLAQAISDVSWSKFFDLLNYKADWNGKHFVQIGRFVTSSQICSNCGTQNPAVKDLAVRNWVCSSCFVEHNRDENAAKNILNFGLIQLGIKELVPSINKSVGSGVDYNELRTTEATNL